VGAGLSHSPVFVPPPWAVRAADRPAERREAKAMHLRAHALRRAPLWTRIERSTLASTRAPDLLRCWSVPEQALPRSHGCRLDPLVGPKAVPKFRS